MARMLRADFMALLATMLWGQFGNAQSTPLTKQPSFKNLEGYVRYIQSHHKAPFDRDSVRLPQGGAAKIMKGLSGRIPETLMPGTGGNVKINRDRDPWPKAEIAVGVDPVNGNVVVMSNDFRENYDHMFYHVSSNGGAAWTDDSMVGGNDPFSGFIPLTFESDPGVAFDVEGPACDGELSSATSVSLRCRTTDEICVSSSISI